MYIECMPAMLSRLWRSRQMTSAPPGKLHVGDARLPHHRVECDLRHRHLARSHQALAPPRPARRRKGEPVLHVGGEDLIHRAARCRQGVGQILNSGSQAAAGHDEPALLRRSQHHGILESFHHTPPRSAGLMSNWMHIPWNVPSLSSSFGLRTTVNRLPK